MGDARGFLFGGAGLSSVNFRTWTDKNFGSGFGGLDRQTDRTGLANNPDLSVPIATVSREKSGPKRIGKGTDIQHLGLKYLAVFPIFVELDSSAPPFSFTISIHLSIHLYIPDV